MEIRLVGTVRAVRGAEVLDLGSTGQKAVLAVLALHAGRVVTLDRLVDLIWGEEPPERAVHAIRVHVSRLRRILEADPSRPSLLLTEPGGYRLAVDEGSVDVLRVERLAGRVEALVGEGDHEEATALAEEAFALMSEQPLAEFPAQEFAEDLRRRMDLVQADLVEHWAHARLALGADGHVEERLREVLDRDPYRERGWELLALALYRGRRQAEALRTLRRAETALAEIGLLPGPSMRSLEEAILRHDPSLSPPPAPGLHNLPVPVGTFVGRRREVDDVLRLLETRRLVTLIGPGGIGKTRLAVEVGWRSIGAHPDGVWLVELAPVDTGQLVTTTMEALEAPARVGRRDMHDLIRHLRDRRLLLVLDNAEHLVDEVADLILTVLQRCPGVRILATGREPIRVAGETVHPVPPMQVPVSHGAPGDLVEHDAVAFFLDRAASSGVAVSPDEHTLVDVVSIVRRLDGLPLAIELAASRLPMLPLPELARRVENLFPALGTGPRTAPPRHRTLHEAFAWSHRLLDPREQRAFESLSLLRGDFGLTAAAAIIGTDAAEDILEAPSPSRSSPPCRGGAPATACSNRSASSATHDSRVRRWPRHSTDATGTSSAWRRRCRWRAPPTTPSCRPGSRGNGATSKPPWNT